MRWVATGGCVAATATVWAGKTAKGGRLGEGTATVMMIVIARKIAEDTETGTIDNRRWDRADQEHDRGYYDEGRPRRRVKVCVEYENGDEYPIISPSPSADQPAPPKFFGAFKQTTLSAGLIVGMSSSIGHGIDRATSHFARATSLRFVGLSAFRLHGQAEFDQAACCLRKSRDVRLIFRPLTMEARSTGSARIPSWDRAPWRDDRAFGLAVFDISNIGLAEKWPVGSAEFHLQAMLCAGIGTIFD